MHIDLSWLDFKAMLTSREVGHHHFISGEHTHVIAHDGFMTFECKLDPDDESDFTTNFEPTSNVKLSDIDSALIVRNKVAKKGWSYLAMPIELETSKLASVYCSDETGTDRGVASIKFFNGAGTELVAGTQAELDTDCVKTEVTFDPAMDYELMGGSIRHLTKPTSNVRVWVIGGAIGVSTKEFIGGTNLAYLESSSTVESDGRASKYMTAATGPYDTNDLKLIIRHDAGFNHKIMFTIEYYRA